MGRNANKIMAFTSKLLTIEELVLISVYRSVFYYFNSIRFLFLSV